MKFYETILLVEFSWNRMGLAPIAGDTNIWGPPPRYASLVASPSGSSISSGHSSTPSLQSCHPSLPASRPRCSWYCSRAEEWRNVALQVTGCFNQPVLSASGGGWWMVVMVLMGQKLLIILEGERRGKWAEIWSKVGGASPKWNESESSMS